ncbi:DUF5689 domain-containing protein [Tamlana sp. 2_MG-2023]|uniref:DUF5689 domain-containing protein n=1 Tax=unclassified Tamlana TaxID=2614803 RepID=UPI0026E22B6F|nr:MULTISPECIES: DUF5689 domain-containing protein [unclassified Tamlana]MDO6761527.1 DUF5689 domain-containing protein [Tamlana sp. 2_MG-2023]MDO6792379.1 DUF5689 domain-containing protein [Tamlana sp. 1_MG-2023]
MKNNLLKPIIALFIIITTVISCADDDISIPDLDIENEETIDEDTDEDVDDEENKEEITNFTVTDLSEIEGFYTEDVIAFAETTLLPEQLMTSGFVISSDYDRNINHQIYIQDKANEPTRGVVIDVDVDDIYRTLSVGQEVQVKLNGLGMQKIGNTIHIGTYDQASQSITPISSENFEDFIIATQNIQSIVPKLLTIEQIQQGTLPTILVTLENIQLREDLLESTYAGTDNTISVDGTHVIKALTDCDTGLSIDLQNSTSSNFNSRVFPEGQGSITAILSSNTLVIRDRDDIVFDGPRCVIEEAVLAPGVLLSEDFQNVNNIDDVFVLNQWENINISNPELLLFWKAQITDDNIFAEIEQGGPSSIYDAWLITEAITIDQTRTLKLAFDINVNKHNSDNLKLFIIDDVTGQTINFDEANEIEDVVPLNETNGFIPIETTITIPQDLEHFRIGFRYKKGSTAATTEYQIDNILVTEDPIQ